MLVQFTAPPMYTNVASKDNDRKAIHHIMVCACNAIYFNHGCMEMCKFYSFSWQGLNMLLTTFSDHLTEMQRYLFYAHAHVTYIYIHALFTDE